MLFRRFWAEVESGNNIIWTQPVINKFALLGGNCLTIKYALAGTLVTSKHHCQAMECSVGLHLNTF